MTLREFLNQFVGWETEFILNVTIRTDFSAHYKFIGPTTFKQMCDDICAENRELLDMKVDEVTVTHDYYLAIGVKSFSKP